MLVADAAGVRTDLISKVPLSGRDGVDGDPSKASAERGHAMLDLKVASAVRQIKAFLKAHEIVPNSPTGLDASL